MTESSEAETDHKTHTNGEEQFDPIVFLVDFVKSSKYGICGMIMFALIVYYGGGLQQYQTEVEHIHRVEQASEASESKAALAERNAKAQVNKTQVKAAKIEHESQARMSAAKATSADAKRQQREAAAVSAAAKEQVRVAEEAEEKAIANATASAIAVQHIEGSVHKKLDKAKQMKEEAAMMKEEAATKEKQAGNDIKRADLEKEHPAEWAAQEVEEARKSSIEDVHAAQAATQNAQSALAQQQASTVVEAKKAQRAVLQAKEKESEASSQVEVWQACALVGWILVLALVGIASRKGWSPGSYDNAGSDDMREGLLEAGRQVRQMKQELEYEQILLATSKSQSRSLSTREDRDRVCNEVSEKIARMEAMLARLK